LRRSFEEKKIRRHKSEKERTSGREGRRRWILSALDECDAPGGTAPARWCCRWKMDKKQKERREIRGVSGG